MCLLNHFQKWPHKINQKLLRLKFYWNTGSVDERDLGPEPTDVDRVLPVLQRLRHYEGVDVRSVLPVLIMLQRFDSKDNICITTANCVVQHLHQQGTVITAAECIWQFPIIYHISIQISEQFSCWQTYLKNPK